MRAVADSPARDRLLLLFTKPARPGRVKTRLIGELNAGQAAALHAAFTEDILARLEGGDFGVRIAWALAEGEEMPAGPFPGVRQEGVDLGARLYGALSGAAAEMPAVAALGSDHPTLPLDLIHRAFTAVEAGRQVVLGPAEDGGYYLIALARAAVLPRLFEGIAWSTGRVLAQTLERCRELGLDVELLPEAADVDTPEDLARLAARFAAEPEGDLGCPRTRALLAAWGRIGSPAVEALR